MSHLQKQAEIVLNDVKNDWNKPANIVTFVRLFLSWIPAAIILSQPFGPTWWWAFAAFAAIAATDKLDGWLARLRGEVTHLGKLLDPAVDIVLIGLTLIALSLLQPVLWLFVACLVIYEAAIGYTCWRASKASMNVYVVKAGKAKMVIQVMGIAVLIAPIAVSWWTDIRYVVIIVMVVSMIISWKSYYRQYG